MIGQNVTKLIIVCDNNTSKFANLLRQLISSKDDKDGQVVGAPDGMVDAAVWTTNQYTANAPTLSSNSHVLFIGKNKVSQSEVCGMEAKFDKCGMKYGWLGKRGMMDIERVISDGFEYDDLMKICQEYQTKYNSFPENNLSTLKETKTEDEKKNDGFSFLKNKIRQLGDSFQLEILPEQRKTLEEQYKILTYIFYFEALNKFLEE